MFLIQIGYFESDILISGVFIDLIVVHKREFVRIYLLVIQ